MAPGRLSLAIIFLAASQMLSCRFAPDGLNFVTVEEVTETSIEIDLDMAEDTIALPQQAKFLFTVDTKGKQLKGVAVIFRGSEVSNNITSTSNSVVSGEFYLNPTDHQTGFHQLSITAITNSGSGSIADLSGAENFSFEKIWHIEIDLDAPSEVSIGSITPSNGSLQISWGNYSRINFRRYTVETEIQGQFRTVAVIDDIDQNITFDSSYVGGRRNYRLTVQDWNGQTSQSVVVPFSRDFPEVQVTQNSPFMQTITWGPTEFPANLQEYEIRNTAGLLHRTADTNNLSFTINPVSFGSKTTITHRTIGKSLGSFLSYADTTFTLEVGSPMPPFQDIVYNGVEDLYYLFNQAQVEAYSLESMSTLGTGSYDDIAITSNSAYARQNSSVWKIDPGTLIILEELDIPAILRYQASIHSLFATSTDELAIVTQNNFPDHGVVDSIHVVDPATLTLVKSLPLGNITEKLIISRDLKYVIKDQFLLEFVPGAKRPQPIETYPGLLGFNENDSEEVYTLLSNPLRLVTRNTQDFSVKNEQSLSGTNLQGLMPQNLILTSGGGTLFLQERLTGEPIAAAPITAGTFFVINKHLFGTNGFVLQNLY